MRLLAGKDCLRDAAEAQRMLLYIAEGADKVAAADAVSILQRAMKNGWLEERTPLYSELERLAEASLSRNSRTTEIKLALVAGLTLLALLGGVFFALETSVEIPWILIGVVCLIVLSVAIALMPKYRT
jgi:hypothetical protein